MAKVSLSHEQLMAVYEDIGMIVQECLNDLMNSYEKQNSFTKSAAVREAKDLLLTTFAGWLATESRRSS